MRLRSAATLVATYRACERLKVAVAVVVWLITYAVKVDPRTDFQSVTARALVSE